MFRREITNYLINWKNKNDKKILMVRGARQIGKTYSIEDFGNSNYGSFLTVNFIKEPELKKIFSGNLDAKTILLNMSLYISDFKVIPNDTLIFLDEIQECPEAITSLKFLNNDKSFDVIVSGSMLGIDYNRPVSYPVGSLEYYDMHPLNFREFLWAQGVPDEIFTILEDSLNNLEPIPLPIHDKLMNYIREYMVLGGMPEVLDIYFNQRSFSEADKKQRAILEDYRYDIAHYASADVKIKAEKCYFSIAEQLTKENHKFMYSLLEKGGTNRKFGNSLDWLTRANLIYKSYNINNYSIPLESNKDITNYRVYPSDIGLLSAMFNYSLKEELIMNSSKRINSGLKGGLYESLVADMLIKNGHKELFFKKTENSNFEIEFIIENKDGIIPIEVKSGRSRSKSLDNLLKKDEIKYGYKLINGNIGMVDKKITLPIYMAMFIK